MKTFNAQKVGTGFISRSILHYLFLQGDNSVSAEWSKDQRAAPGRQEGP